MSPDERARAAPNPANAYAGFAIQKEEHSTITMGELPTVFGSSKMRACESPRNVTRGVCMDSVTGDASFVPLVNLFSRELRILFFELVLDEAYPVAGAGYRMVAM